MNVLRRLPLACLAAALVAACAAASGLAVPARAFAAAASGGAKDDAPVVVIGMTGLTWGDISDEATPNLHAFAEKSAGANLVVRTVTETTCPAQGWMGLGAGMRLPRPASGCVAPLRTGRAALAGFPEETAAMPPEARASFGSIAEGLDPKQVLAIGDGAALALADDKGRVRARIPELSGDGARSASAVAQAYSASGGAQARLVVADLGSVLGSKAWPENTRASKLEAIASFFTAPRTEPTTAMRAEIARIDAAFGRLLSAIDAEAPNSKILVASVADRQPERPSLQFFAARGLDGKASLPALVASASTQTAGLVQLTDLAPTVRLLSGASPASRAGNGQAPLVASRPATDLPRELADAAARALQANACVGPFFTVLLVLAVASVACATRALRREAASARQLQRTAELGAFAAAVPVASILANLVPWWRSGHPRATLAAAIATIAALIALAATSRRSCARPGTVMASVGGLGFAVLGLDLLAARLAHATSLQTASMLGTRPQTGFRFYGMANLTFATFAAGLVLLLAVAAARLKAAGRTRDAGILVVTLGTLAALADGLSLVGADFGGPPAIVAATGLMFLVATDRPRTVARLALIGLLALASSILFVLLDSLLPASRQSHLGNLVPSAQNGSLGTIVARKLSLLAFGLPWPVALAALAAILVLAAFALRSLRSGRLAALGFLRPAPAAHVESSAGLLHETIRLASIGLAAVLAVSFAMNDSGLAIPLTGLAVALPAIGADRALQARRAALSGAGLNPERH